MIVWYFVERSGLPWCSLQNWLYLTMHMWMYNVDVRNSKKNVHTNNEFLLHLLFLRCVLPKTEIQKKIMYSILRLIVIIIVVTNLILNYLPKKSLPYSQYKPSVFVNCIVICEIYMWKMHTVFIATTAVNKIGLNFN